MAYKKINCLFFIFLFFISLIFCPTLLKAQEEIDVLHEIEIRSKIRRAELESTSASVITNEEIRDRIYISPLYILRQTPGVRINEFSEQGVAASVQMRGMSGGHGGEVGFYMDGIPLNDNVHSDNYIDTSILIPLELETVEVMKGPVSALYGKGTGAGTIAFQSIKTGNLNRFFVRYGSYNHANAAALIARDFGKFHQVYAIDAFHSDNSWHENSKWNRLNLSGRWTYDVSENFLVSFNLRAAYSKWDNNRYSASWLPLEKAPDNGSGDSGGGHRYRYDARFFANLFLNPQTQLSYYFFASSVDSSMGELTYPATRPGPYTGNPNSGNEQVGERSVYGTGFSYNFSGELIPNHDFSLTFGLDYLHEKQKLDNYRYKWDTGPERTEHYNDVRYTLRTISFFGEAIFGIFENLSARIGGRYDNLTGDISFGAYHAARPNENYNAKVLSIFSPKFGLVYSPFDYLDVYTNYGKGWGMPGISSGQYFMNHQLKQTIRDQYEFGFRLRPINWIEFGAVYFLARTSNDIGTPTGAPEPENIGTTEKRGIETYIMARPFEHIYISANYSYLDAKLKKQANPVNNGRRVTGHARHIYNIEISYSPPLGFGGRATFNYNANILNSYQPSGPYYNSNYGSLDLQASYKFNDSYTVKLDILNVTNDRPVQGSKYNQYYTYAPVAPITAYVTLEMNF
ncbi:MAG: TonB-dependent receptor [Endomicrobium sp.]|jgi:iron complex outermembrane receptor protein|nr:TonB-dependent receptor [Endomicrobium sp.]